MFGWLVEHIIGIVPFWVWLTVACAGGVGYFFFGIITMIPFLMPYREPIKIVCIVICLGGTFMCGGDGVTTIWQAQIKEAQAKVAAAETKSKEANVVIQKVYIDRVKKVKELQVVYKDRIKEVEKVIDAECKVAPEAISILNDAAKLRKGSVTNEMVPQGDKK
jgi:hypothetical protein